MLLIAQQLRREREARGLSVAALARTCQISDRAIHNAERNACIMLHTLVVILDALETTPAEFFERAQSDLVHQAS